MLEGCPLSDYEAEQFRALVAVNGQNMPESYYMSERAVNELYQAARLRLHDPQPQTTETFMTVISFPGFTAAVEAKLPSDAELQARKHEQQSRVYAKQADKLSRSWKSEIANWHGPND